MAANPELTKFLDRRIGTKWHKDANLKPLIEYQDDENILEELKAIKHDRKVKLANHLERTKGVAINPNSIIDIQIKRIHEYKRQQMLALYIIYKYLDIKKEIFLPLLLQLFLEEKQRQLIPLLRILST
jgi:Glucan phosphorylase